MLETATTTELARYYRRAHCARALAFRRALATIFASTAPHEKPRAEARGCKLADGRIRRKTARRWP